MPTSAAYSKASPEGVGFERRHGIEGMAQPMMQKFDSFFRHRQSLGSTVGAVTRSGSGESYRIPIRYPWMPQRATVVSGGSVAVYAGCYARRFSRPTGLNI
jgi:hypothetical protein